jgi:hypothetical protein
MLSDFLGEDGDFEKALILLVMLVHFFGARSSPCVANFGLQMIQEANKADFSPGVYWSLKKLLRGRFVQVSENGGGGNSLGPGPEKNGGQGWLQADQMDFEQ